MFYLKFVNGSIYGLDITLNWSGKHFDILNISIGKVRVYLFAELLLLSTAAVILQHGAFETISVTTANASEMNDGLSCHYDVYTLKFKVLPSTFHAINNFRYIWDEQIIC